MFIESTYCMKRQDKINSHFLRGILGLTEYCNTLIGKDF